mgnify:CR=1 FL=1|tara:strand:+ start:1137 stop:1496 length:360 start_codon:yes stop_codon:yes gene_type:complete
MKVSKWFSKEEFACKCGCGEDFDMDPKLLTLLDKIRENIGNAITVTSGYRCKAHNDSLGSKETSQHRKATAADITLAYHKPAQVADIAESMLEEGGGLGRYTSFTHIDTRSRKARWGSN